MWKEARYQLTASAPLLMHNGQLANPLSKWSKAMKQISSKRLKTDADVEELAHLEFQGSIYMSENGPVIPAEMIEAMLRDAAKKTKEGKLAQAGMFCTEHAELQYDGPRDTESLWKDERFRHSAVVRVQSNRVVRTRPIFREWSAVAVVQYEDEVINISRLDEWFRIGGQQVGVGDWRPRHGRFEAQRLT